MFWDQFIKLCNEHNTKPNPVAKELGISSGILTKWKSGSLPSTDALLKISEYFNVSIDYLLGRTEHMNCSGNIDSIITHGSDNVINNNSNNITQSAPIENDDVWATYSKLSTKDKLEVQLDILNRGNK